MTTFHNCTIERTFKRRSGHMRLDTGRITYTKTEWVTEPCNTPLFGDEERESGICNACAKGWSVKESTFAVGSEEGRRALTEGVRRGFFDLGSGKLHKVAFRAAGHMLDAKAALEAQAKKE